MFSSGMSLNSSVHMARSVLGSIFNKLKLYLHKIFKQNPCNFVAKELVGMFSLSCSGIPYRL